MVYCSHCYCGDLLELKDYLGQDFYYHQFVDHYHGHTHCFSGKPSFGSAEKWKEGILRKLEEIFERSGRDWTDVSLRAAILTYAEETGNPYGLILARDNFQIVLTYYQERLEKRKRKFEEEQARRELERLRSLGKEERKREIEEKDERLLKEVERINEQLQHAGELNSIQRQGTSTSIERGGVFCPADCICLKDCKNFGKVEDCSCPCKYGNVVKIEFCSNFSPK